VQAQLGVGMPVFGTGETELACGADDQAEAGGRGRTERGSDDRSASCGGLRCHLRHVLAHLRLRRLSLDQAGRATRRAPGEALTSSIIPTGEIAGRRPRRSGGRRDRKSTRLNSSHVSISYAVFCLKKKKK